MSTHYISPSTILSLVRCCTLLCVLSDLLFAVLARHPLHFTECAPPTPCCSLPLPIAGVSHPSMVQPPHSKTWLRDAQRIPSHQISFTKPLHHKTFSSLRLTPTRSMLNIFPTFSDKPSLISNVGTRGVTLRNQQVQCFHQTHLMITEAPFKSNTQLLNTNLCLILSKRCESPTHVANVEVPSWPGS